MGFALNNGYVYGLTLALEASEDESEVEAASQELHRLEGVMRRFNTPGPGSGHVHFEMTEDGWLAHHMRVNDNGILSIKTRVTPLLSSAINEIYHLNTF